MTKEEYIDQIIENNVFRKCAFDFIPEGSSRILDFGCNQGELLHRLRRDKGCSELYGIEIEPFDGLQYLDEAWIIDLQEEGAELDKDFLEYFNYLILHDVIEHLYDPWYVLAKLHKYAHNSTQVLVVFPNAQYCYLLYAMLSGYFPYGYPGGYFNEEHIRWFTLRSAIELLMLAGYDVIKGRGAYLPGAMPPVDEVASVFELPPSQIRTNEEPVLVELPYKMYTKCFLAMKYALLCTPTLEPMVDSPIRKDALCEMRIAIEDDATEAYWRLLPEII